MYELFDNGLLGLVLLFAFLLSEYARQLRHDVGVHTDSYEHQDHCCYHLQSARRCDVAITNSAYRYDCPIARRYILRVHSRIS